MSHNEKLAALLARYSYREGDFVLSSGAHSAFYLDAKQVTYHPDGVELVGSAIADIIAEYGAEAVGGLTMGADAIVTSVVWASARSDRPVTGFVVRKEPKGHGLKKWIEGVSPEGKRVAIVEDVVTSGQSLMRAVERAREARATVVVAVSLVDREEGGAVAIEAAGIPFRAVCTLSDIRIAAVAAGA